ncbi:MULTISPECIES: GGDEF domain-containing protein [Halomonas]|uniref:diguanylate cyclase n=1 Tax=Halomonas halophila TaxID=29573 RepID=A0ABQ0U195_9GAMM|nr:MULTISPECIES: GGDEF domain-containing protein [Halomonas]MDR5888150.1 GGDEF domain-containing protein [Halomonas salina]WJY08670.1 GGDEF domain-containing protein [Halomonas halophila]GEK72307.1 hypothetical protein HHA04nite_08510 [Halomonas halophila]
MTPAPGLRSGLLAGFCLLAALGAIVAGAFSLQAGRHLGADYSALAGDLVRAQEDTAELRLELNALRNHPHHRWHLTRIASLVARVPERIGTIRQGLSRSEIGEARYAPMLAELSQAETLYQRLASVIAAPDGGTDMDVPQLHRLGHELESTLAWTYSSLLEDVHRAAADQQRLMKWLSLAVVLLVILVLLVAAALMLALARIHRQWRSLRELSVTDELTRLANRRRLWEVAERYLELNRRDGGELSLLLIDLDHFKRFNDRYGHPAGDAVLQAVAAEFARLGRESDLVARLGGEEFAVLMPNTGLEGARQLGERLREATAGLPLPGQAGEQRLTISLGLATTRGGGDTLAQLYSRADRGLYRAKQNGRNRLEINAQA